MGESRKILMAQAVPGTLKKTPLNARHRSLGARMVEFGGWDMPVEYSGVVDEHMASAAEHFSQSPESARSLRPP